MIWLFWFTFLAALSESNKPMTDELVPTNVINMQARARLIREAQEAREKRHRERGLFANLTADQQRQALEYRGEEMIGPQFPGGIDDMEV